MVYVDFSLGFCFIFLAQKVGGQIDLFVNCMVCLVEIGLDGKAKVVSYVNKVDWQEYQIKGKVIVLAVLVCFIVCILFNFKEGGLGNGSGVIGCYFYDFIGFSMYGFFLDLMDCDCYNEDGVGGMYVYFFWWEDNKKLDFLCGYYIEVWGG